MRNLTYSTIVVFLVEVIKVCVFRAASHDKTDSGLRVVLLNRKRRN